VILAYLVLKTPFWAWVLFGVDYMLGNPSSINWYRDELFEHYWKAWPLKKDEVFVPSIPFQEMDGAYWSFAAFDILTERRLKPLIIRGIFKNASALNWTPEHLAKSFGDRDFFAFADNRFGVADADVSTFRDTIPNIVRNITNGGNNYVFNANFENPTDMHLYDDIGLDRLYDWRRPAVVQFFLGLAREGEKRLGGSPLHAAVPPNLNVQLSGSKRWIMVDPKYSLYMRPRLLSDQVALVTEATFEYDAESRWHNFPRYEGLIHPGDAIFIPPWWYHEVHNIQGPKWQISLAVRYSDIVGSWLTNWWYALLIDIGVRDKPCWPGFRLICLELFKGWQTGKNFNVKHNAGEELPAINQLYKERVDKVNRYE